MIYKTVGIVGSGKDKFTSSGMMFAVGAIGAIMLAHPKAIIVSGHSPMGGIDIWTEELAKKFERKTDIKAPKQHSWNGSYGYKARNIDIAKSDKVYVIVPDEYPKNYTGRIFKSCYHCDGYSHELANPKHIKSGGCWTGWWAREHGNDAEWIVVKNNWRRHR